MILEWLKPLLDWTGFDLIPFLLVLLLIGLCLIIGFLSNKK